MANKFALIIANSRYEHPKIRDLFKTAADAGGMRQVLVEVCGFPEAHITVLQDKPSYEVRLGIGKFFRNKRPDDLLLFYFAGHGMRASDGHLCMTFTDTDPEYCEETSIEARDISRQMDRSRSKRQLVVLDCCYSGAFAHGARDVVGSTMDTEESFRGARDGKGRFVITSSDKLQFSLEDAYQEDATDFAVFTHYVIEGLRSGKAALEQGDITVRSLYDYVYEQVTMATEGRQTPKLINYGSEGRLVLAAKPHPPLPAGLKKRLADNDYKIRISAVYELKTIIEQGSTDMARFFRTKIHAIFRYAFS